MSMRAAGGAARRRSGGGGGGGSVTFDNTAGDTTGEEVTSLTSAGFTISSSANRAVFGFGASFSADQQAPNAMRIGGSGGTVMSTLGAAMTAQQGRAQGYTVAPAPSGSQAAYCTFATAPQFSLLQMLSYTGVHQTTPFVNAATPTNGIVQVPGGGGATSGTASITINTTGLIGQKVVVFMKSGAGGGDIPTFTPQGAVTVREFTSFLDFMFLHALEFTATGASTTVDVLISGLSTPDAFVGWEMVGFVVNPA